MARCVLLLETIWERSLQKLLGKLRRVQPQEGLLGKVHLRHFSSKYVLVRDLSGNRLVRKVRLRDNAYMGDNDCRSLGVNSKVRGAWREGERREGKMWVQASGFRASG